MESKMIKVQVPASTANMGPGFDILGLALNLYNTIEVELLSGDKVQITYSGEGSDVIPCDQSNLVYKAIQSVFEQTKQSMPGISINIKNEIPLMGGLGSSSSAIVSGIVAGNALCEKKLSEKELLQLAVKLDGHPDNVTPALFGGFTFSYLEEDGSSDVIQLKFPNDIGIIAVSPQFYVSTSDARKVMPKQYLTKTVINNATQLFRFVKALETKDFSHLRMLLDDQIHQPYRFPLVPGLKKASEVAYEKGAVGSFISGSGPTLIALAVEQPDIIAEEMVAVFEAEGLVARIRYLQPDFAGARLC